ncbi:hypothetical protein PMZ80_001647 [Knufia obscura]|uniref:Uncharacterized protein n=1 Tax=Knufia obscura TaxID=1635080 RepID=A0ABR0S3Q8_9EURO|nr:hypothetical protein PMZ80_001647 [Knufia obscura]
MPYYIRGIEGPTPQRPQVSNVGRRPRPCHLARTARLNADQVPVGLTNFSGNAERPNSGPVRGHSYRNAVFQVLMNAPIFVNFLRAHNRRIRLLLKGKECTVGKQCLTCGLVALLNWYWAPVRDAEAVAGLKIATTNLWNLCLNNFWGKQSQSSQDLGPIDNNEEYHPESFLLYLLTAIQRQLEAIPGEYQTFLSLFTFHTVRRWKCPHKCSWTSNTDQWEQSLYLPLNNLFMQNWTSARDVTPDAHKLKAISQGYNEAAILYTSPARDYKLIAGIGERVIDGNRSKSVAFARTPSEQPGEWWLMDDDLVDPVPGLDQLDRLQRRWDGRGPKIYQNFFPEIFVYRRTDNAGWDVNYQTHTEGLLGIQTLDPLFPLAKTYDIRGRSATEIFTQKVGQGLLKFKIRLAPADPGPQDSMPFDLEIGYEYKGQHYRLDGKRLQAMLVPVLPSEPVEDLRPTPFEESVIERARRLQDRPGETAVASYSTALTTVDNQINDASTMNLDPSQPAVNPFAVVAFAQPQKSPNSMDLDDKPVTGFLTGIQNPDLRANYEQTLRKNKHDLLQEILDSGAGDTYKILGRDNNNKGNNNNNNKKGKGKHNNNNKNGNNWNDNNNRNNNNGKGKGNGWNQNRNNNNNNNNGGGGGNGGRGGRKGKGGGRKGGNWNGGGNGN